MDRFIIGTAAAKYKDLKAIRPETLPESIRGHAEDVRAQVQRWLKNEKKYPEYERANLILGLGVLFDREAWIDAIASWLAENPGKETIPTWAEFEALWEKVMHYAAIADTHYGRMWACASEAFLRDVKRPVYRVIEYRLGEDLRFRLETATTFARDWVTPRRRRG